MQKKKKKKSCTLFFRDDKRRSAVDKFKQTKNRGLNSNFFRYFIIQIRTNIYSFCRCTGFVDRNNRKGEKRDPLVEMDHEPVYVKYGIRVRINAADNRESVILTVVNKFRNVGKRRLRGGACAIPDICIAGYMQ